VPEKIVVVNPRASSGRAQAVWQSLGIAGEEALVIESDSPEQARRKMAAAVLERDVDTVVAVGGDGTVQSAANFLLDHGLADRVPLGIVPAGTGSDLARTLGIPADPRKAWERIGFREIRTIDAFRLETASDARWVVNIASFGLSGIVGERVNATAERSEWTYLRETIKAIRRSEAVGCRIHTDGQQWFEGEVLLVAVANGRQFGRGMQIAPEARTNDGLLDVIVVERMPRWKQLLRLPRVLRGTHLGLREVYSRRAQRVEIEPLGISPPYELDGELLPSGPASFDLRPDALRVIV